MAAADHSVITPTGPLMAIGTAASTTALAAVAASTRQRRSRTSQSMTRKLSCGLMVDTARSIPPISQRPRRAWYQPSMSATVAISVVWPAQMTKAVAKFPITSAGISQPEASPGCGRADGSGWRANHTQAAARSSAAARLRPVMTTRAPAGDHAASRRQRGAICGG